MGNGWWWHKEELLLLICSYAKAAGGGSFYTQQVPPFQPNLFMYRAGLFLSGFIADPWELDLTQLNNGL